MPALRPVLFLLVLAIVAAACTSEPEAPVTPPPTPVTPAPTTAPPVTTAAPTTPPATTPAPTTTRAPTTTPGPTTTTSSTEAPLASVLLEGGLPERLEAIITDLYNWLGDRRHSGEGFPAELRRHLEDLPPVLVPQRTVRSVVEEVRDGEQVAVIHVDGDLLFGVDEGSGWEIVGASIAGATLWLGAEPLFLLVIGSDARPGQLQPRLRGDSLHVIALAPSADAGTILGFPRDSYITRSIILEANETAGLARSDLPGGSIKWTNLMARRGPEIMLGVARALTDLPIAGYVLTGFQGFEELMRAIGGLDITLEKRVPVGAARKAFPVGEQHLTAMRTLLLARLRKTISGGDFTRSLNQGVIMLAAMTMLQERGIDGLPELLRILIANTWTDLSTTDLLRFSVASLMMDTGGLENLVAKGTVANIGGASVVLLDEDFLEEVSADLAPDGVLTPLEDSSVQ